MNWLYSLKKKILLLTFAIMSVLIIGTMFSIALMLRSTMINETKIKSQELSNAVQTTLSSLMMTRNPDVLQETIERIGGHNSSVAKAFVIDRNGKVVYSSDKNDIGRVLDRFSETSCHVCHMKNSIPSENTTIVNVNGQQVLRSVRVIFNEEKCSGCHQKAERINGKFIIDRSLTGTYSFIAKVELIIFISGFICIIILAPVFSGVLSKGINKYIDEILHHNIEMKMLYAMIERLSKTIDLEELKSIVIEIIRDSFKADEITLILHKVSDEYRATVWSNQDNALMRKKIDSSDPLFPAVNDWLSGKITENAITKDNKTIYMPIRQENTNIALIIAKKTEGSFEDIRPKLIEIMSSHISVAFEKAFLYHIAITDELTGLYTQRHFRATIAYKFADSYKYGDKLSLLFLDIDNFKKINDNYGHMVGDSVLRDIAKTMLLSIRDSDFAFRYGGEEFAVILPSTERSVAIQVAERIREDIEKRIFEEGTLNLKLTVSIGLSIFPDNTASTAGLIFSADQSLYKAKEAGKNRVIWS